MAIIQKPGNLYFILDFLSRLKTRNKNPIINEESELDILFTIVMVKINNNFQNDLLKYYTNDPLHSKIYIIFDK